MHTGHTDLFLSTGYHPTTALDYPPFFAYFSYLLSLPLKLLPNHQSSRLLQISAKPIDGWDVVAYMRTSVVLSEIVLILGLFRLQSGDSIGRKSDRKDTAMGTTMKTTMPLALAIAFHPGFLILDHIHFQYNGFLFGIMIWSLIGSKEVC